YASAHAFIEALNGAMNTATVGGHQVQEPIRGTDEMGRGRRKRVLALIVFVIALGITALLVYWSSKPAPVSGGKVEIVSLQASNYRGDPPVPLGQVGITSHDIRFDDSVRLRAEMNGPACC